MDKLLYRSLFPSFESALIAELEKAAVRMYAAGTQLIRTGEYFRATMLIIKGLVKVYREDEEGNEFFMYYLEPGQACALSIVCASNQKTSQLMAVALQNTEVVLIPLETADKWMMTYKTWYRYVQDTYRSRFEELLIVIDHIAFRSMDERVDLLSQKTPRKIEKQYYQYIIYRNCSRPEFIQGSDIKADEKISRERSCKPASHIF